MTVRDSAIQPAYSSPRPAARPRSTALYYITDRVQLAPDEPSRLRLLLERIAAAARAGIDYIQLREKDLPVRSLESLAAAAVAAVRSENSRTRLLVNGRIDVAIACGTDGVHLPSAGAISAADARAAFHAAGMPAALVAASCHTPDDVARAAAHGADFAVFGPVFGKGPDAVHERVDPAGVDALRHACDASIGAMPVLALGSVTMENAAECLRAGASGVAGIRLFQSGDLAATVASLRSLMSS